MAAQEKAIPSLPIANTFSQGNDHVVAVANGVTSLISVGSLVTLPVTNTTPTNSNAIVIQAPAQAWTDGNYLYVVTANNTIKRVGLSSF